MPKNEPYLLTLNGRRYDFFNPDPKQIDVQDIAHSLSQLCRYVGHTPDFYSVAEHSVLVSQVVPREHALVALMHDAVECYVNDLSAPCKQALRYVEGSTMSSYDKLEQIAWEAVARRFDLPLVLPEEVIEADHMVGEAECVALGRPHRYGEGYKDERHKAAEVHVSFLCSRIAKMVFLARYDEVMRGRS